MGSEKKDSEMEIQSGPKGVIDLKLNLDVLLTAITLNRFDEVIPMDNLKVIYYL